MNVNTSTAAAIPSAWVQPAAAKPPSRDEAGKEELREAFQSFVGETLFGQLLEAMRRTVGKPAYFHGGRAEEIFEQQLDQVLAEKMAATSAAEFSGPMLELFCMSRQ
jgi:hypothetical protein